MLHIAQNTQIAGCQSGEPATQPPNINPTVADQLMVILGAGYQALAPSCKAPRLEVSLELSSIAGRMATL